MRHFAVLSTVALCAASLQAQTAAPAAPAQAPPSLTAPAAPAPISPEKQAKIEQLLTLLTVDKQMQDTIAATHLQLHKMASQRAAQASNDDQKKAGDAYVKQVDDAVVNVTWDRLKPQIVRAYADELSDADVDAYIKFFSSPAGQDFIKQSPVIGQKVVTAAQGLMREASPALQAATKEFNEKMQASTPPKLSPLEPPHAPAALPAPTK